jgi:hypothetical protein
VRRLTALGCAAVACGVVGCETQVTEYRRRPSFYRMASDVELVDEYIDENGRRIVFVEDGPLPSEQRRRDKERAERDAKRKARKDADRKARIAAGEVVEDEEEGEPKQFASREVMDDGEVVLRAMLPEHVLGNTMECLRNGEFEVLWDQMVSAGTKNEYARRGMNVGHFAEFCRANRSELMKTLNRMVFGFYSGSDVIVERGGDLSVRIRFSAFLGRQFKFKEVVVVQGREGMKLKMIR